MAWVNRIASNKPKLDTVLLCIPSQFGLVKFGWELSGLVWFDIIWCGCRISDRISNADQDLCGLYRYQEVDSTILPSPTQEPFLDFHKEIVGYIWSNVSPYLSAISFVVLWVHILFYYCKERKTANKRDSSTTQLNVEVKQTPIGWTGSPVE